MCYRCVIILYIIILNNKLGVIIVQDSTKEKLLTKTNGNKVFKIIYVHNKCVFISEKIAHYPKNISFMF